MSNNQLDLFFSGSFNSYQGFQRILMTEEQLAAYFSEVLEYSLKNGFGEVNKELKRRFSEAELERLKGHQLKLHKSIRIVDTFFSDTLGVKFLKKLVWHAHHQTRNLESLKGDEQIAKARPVEVFEIKILILDPFKELAKIRAGSLFPNQKSDAVAEVFSSLSDLYKILRSVNHKMPTTTPTDLMDLVSAIQKYGPLSNVYVRFYNSLTEMPVYLISQFAFKGNLFEKQGSAIRKPWLVFVDDLTQNDDMFMQYSGNFDNIFGKPIVGKDGLPVRDNFGNKNFESEHSWAKPTKSQSISNADQCRELLAKNLLEEAIELRKSYHEKINDKNSRDLHIQWSAMLSDLSSQKSNGQIDKSTAETKRAEIFADFLQSLPE